MTSTLNEIKLDKGKSIVTKKRFKVISFVLICLATLLLIVDLAHILTITEIERGILDFMPGRLIQALFISHPLLLLVSGILFFLGKGIKDKLDFITLTLLIMNGLVLLLFLVRLSV